MEPDTIDMMSESELRAEFRNIVEDKTKDQKRIAELEALLKIIRTVDFQYTKTWFADIDYVMKNRSK